MQSETIIRVSVNPSSLQEAIVQVARLILPIQRFEVTTSPDSPFPGMVLLADQSGHDPLEALAPYTPFLETGQGNGPIPPLLILSPRPKRYRVDGLEFSPEFILPLDDLRSLMQRIEMLLQVWDNAFTVPILRDFVVGRLRRELGLDEEHHDTSSNMQADIRALYRWAAGAEDSPLPHGWVTAVKGRITWLENTEAVAKRQLFKCLFSKTLSDMIDKIRAFRDDAHDLSQV